MKGKEELTVVRDGVLVVLNSLEPADVPLDDVVAVLLGDFISGGRRHVHALLVDSVVSVQHEAHIVGVRAQRLLALLIAARFPREIQLLAFVTGIATRGRGERLVCGFGGRRGGGEWHGDNTRQQRMRRNLSCDRVHEHEPVEHPCGTVPELRSEIWPRVDEKLCGMFHRLARRFMVPTSIHVPALPRRCPLLWRGGGGH